MDPGRGTNTGRRERRDDAVVDGRTERAPEPRGDRGGLDEIVRTDNIHWKAVAAGALTAIAAFLLLGLLALGTDLLADDSGASDWVSAIIGLLSFFVGGYVVGEALEHRRDEPSAEDRAEEGRRGLLNGLLSWALANVLILVLSGLGLGQLFGPVGDLMDPLDPEQISDAARDAALGAFLTLLLWALASALDGWLGEKSADRRSPAVRTPDVRARP